MLVVRKLKLVTLENRHCTSQDVHFSTSAEDGLAGKLAVVLKYCACRLLFCPPLSVRDFRTKSTPFSCIFRSSVNDHSSCTQSLTKCNNKEDVAPKPLFFPLQGLIFMH